MPFHSRFIFSFFMTSFSHFYDVTMMSCIFSYHIWILLFVIQSFFCCCCCFKWITLCHFGSLLYDMGFARHCWRSWRPYGGLRFHSSRQMVSKKMFGNCYIGVISSWIIGNLVPHFHRFISSIGYIFVVELFYFLLGFFLSKKKLIFWEKKLFLHEINIWPKK